MAVIVASTAALLLGLAAGVLLTRRRSAGRRGSETAAGGRQEGARAVAAETLLRLLPTATALVDADGVVRLANTAAVEMGIVRSRDLVVDDLVRLVRRARLTGRVQIAELVLDRGGFPRRMLTVGARAEPLADGDVALVVDDLTESKRVEAVRRDFVANVGHEIKTPVGALSLLTEAALDAGDDADALRRFLERMHHETQRLSRLVQELLDLSRVQGAEPLPTDTAVSVDAVVGEAVDRTRSVAQLRQIEIVRGGDQGLEAAGDEGQLVTAVANLLDNAVAYSPAGTQVAVGVHLRDDAIEIAVKDEGIGIAEADRERIFERFYRVDPARSRETGGTGLGLAIVKHIVSNHGGAVSVWSRVGEGSTFTIRLPFRTRDAVAGTGTARPAGGGGLDP